MEKRWMLMTQIINKTMRVKQNHSVVIQVGIVVVMKRCSDFVEGEAVA
jgi:hypothetical protein